MALWGGRFTEAADSRFKAFNDSLPFDWQLAEQDIVGSIAWAEALRQVDVLSESECQQLQQALHALLSDVKANPKQILDSDAEDIHSWVESALIERVGDLGKKLHTGRSRNDQVALDLKLWCKQRGAAIKSALVGMQQALVELAQREAGTVLPGYTHLQRAQPVTMAHWALAYVEMLERDYGRVSDALTRLDSCPLGCGALAGTAYPIDRTQLARTLGFAEATRNSLDTVSDRDHVIELLSAAALSMGHLSRLAEDLIFYNSGEAGFITLSDTVTSGSSLMPQKKNPDALELIRGKCGRVFGALSAMMMTLKALPLAYNKDLQEDKEGLFDALATWEQCLDMATLVLDGIEVHDKRTEQAARQGYANSTELADYLVAKGIPFRQAHHIVGEVVLAASRKQLAIEDLPLVDLQAFSELIGDDVYEHLSLASCFQKRSAIGGVAPMQVGRAIKASRERILAHRHVVRDATLHDVDAIEGLIKHWAEAGENLPRGRQTIIKLIRDFAVIERDGQVVATAALYIYSTGLAEIRSLGVQPDEKGKGYGQTLVQFLLDRAQALALNRVIVLTRVPNFFASQGFALTEKSQLPEKVIQDCEGCPKLHCCDEVAMQLRL